MVFSSPLILWGLLLLSVPVIIHLFQFKRYKKLLFPDVSLLKELQSKSSTRNQLRHLLVLLTRLFFLAFLVMAFAEPLIPPSSTTKSAEPALISIYLDNSFSMDAKSEKGRLFDQARALAYEVAATYPTSTRFQLLTNELSARERKALDFNSLLDRMDETEVSAFAQPLSRIQEFHHQSKADLELQQSVLYLISDFDGIKGDSLVLGDSATEVRILPLQKESTGNISIDSVQIASPSIQAGMDVELLLTVTNHGSAAVENVPLEITTGGEQSCRMLLNLDAKSSLDTLCIVQAKTAGYYEGRAAVDDFPVVYDNEYVFSLLVNDEIIVAEIGTEASTSPFGKLLDSQAFSYSFQPSGQINLGALEDAQLLIFNGIEKWTSGLLSIADDGAANGKTILIIPPKVGSEALSALSSGLGLSFSRIDTQRMDVNFVNTDHPLFKDVFERIPKNLNYPTALKHWQVSADHPSDETILRMVNGTALLGGFRWKAGKVYYTSVPLVDAFTNFHRHALFVPAFYNMAIQSGRLQPLSYQVGASKIDLDMRFSENTEVLKRNDSLRFRPAIGVNELRLYGQVQSNGFYEVNNGDSNLALIAFNYARTESGAEPVSQETIEKLAAQPFVNVIDTDSDQIAQSITQADVGTKLWPLFVLLALTMAMAEIILLKILKA